MTSSRKDIINRMNAWGRDGIPFVFIFDFEAENPLIFREQDLAAYDIAVHLPSKPSEITVPGSKAVKFQKYPISYERYEAAFQTVLEAIHRGNTYLLNLTFPTRIETNLTMAEIFHRSQAKFKLRYEDRLVVFSPEAFVTIRDNIISGFPMKGTLDASIPGAEQLLMNDSKEIAEHNTIVDLIRNDLSMVARQVRVDRFRYLERIRTHEKELLQTSTRISGQLPENWRENIGDILVKMLPAGSVSGAPKRKTVEIIREVEGTDRGYFTGIFGYFDGQHLESAVMIRFIEQQNGVLWFRSGGGITSFSDCAREYRELIDKIYVPIV